MRRDLEFAERLASLIPRGQKGVFARRAGLAPQQLSCYLKGQVPYIDTLQRLATAGGCTVEWLLTGAEPTTKPSVVSEPMTPYNAAPDLTREEEELMDMLLAVLRGRNQENVEAIKSNIRAFYKSREMASEPMLPTRRKAAG